MKGNAFKVVMIVFGVVALATVTLCVGYLLSPRHTRASQIASESDRQNDIRKAAAEADRNVQQTMDEGVKKHPDQTVSEAMRKEAVERSNARINNETNPDRRRKEAASNFMGFYLINMRERTAYCNDYGVSITAFTNAFEQSHTGELAKAKSALAGEPISIEELYSALKPTLHKLIVQDMTDIARTTQGTPKTACELIAQQGATLAGKMHFSRMQPVVYAALMN